MIASLLCYPKTRGRRGMAGYRLYCLDGRGHIQQREDFDAADDDAAIGYAQRTFPESLCELWELGRLVARLPASTKAA